MAPETHHFLDVANMVRDKYSMYPLPTKLVPKFLLYLVGPMMGLSWNFIAHNVGIRATFSVDKIKQEHGFEFTPISQCK